MNLMSGALWAYQRFMQEYEASKSQSSNGQGGAGGGGGNQIGGKRKVTKGRLGNVEFQVNPTTISLGGGMNWSEVASAGRQVPLVQLGCGKSNTFSFELYINEWMFDHKVNANSFVNEIFRCRNSRETVKFVWGKMVKDVVVTNCEIIAQSLKPDLSYREVTMSISLTTVYL